MSDRFYTKITIGGPIAPEHRQRIAVAINAERKFDAIIDVDDYGTSADLVLAASEVTWGEFTDLEPLLRELGIPYDKSVGDGAGDGPIQIYFRPGRELIEQSLMMNGKKVLYETEIRNLIDTMPAEEAVYTIRSMLSEEPELPGMDLETAEYLAEVAERGLAKVEVKGEKHETTNG